MKTRQNKGDFFSTLKSEISHRETLRTFFDTTYQELLKKYDGKVYNKRFDTALNDALKAVSPLMWAKCELQSRNSYSNYKDNNLVQVVINFRNSSHNYNDNESLYTNIVLVTDANYNLRISAEDSGKERYTLAWLGNFDRETETRKAILKDYDKYLRMAEKMVEAVKTYNELPHRFRENIDTQYLRIY